MIQVFYKNIKDLNPLNKIIMKRVDFEIIGKKILVGAILFLVPLIILAGGLTLVNQLLK